MEGTIVAIMMFISIYMGIALIFLMLFMNDYLKLEMKNKKTRKRTEGYERLHILILPFVAISSIIANKKSIEGRHVNDTERIQRRDYDKRQDNKRP